MLDLIIIGGSAAATTAGIYAARRGLNFKIITKEFGGEVATSGEIGNWPGVIHIDGLTLTEQFKDHLASYNITPEEGIWVSSIIKQTDGTFCIRTKTDSGFSEWDPHSLGTLSDFKGIPQGSTLDCDYTAKAVIIATGIHPKELAVPGEKEFRNKGVTYCTTCDGPLFTGKVTTVIGAGNSALEAVLMLSDIASKVYVLNKYPQFKGEQVLIDRVAARNNVEVVYDAMTNEIIGEQFVTGVKYLKNGKQEELKTDGVFIHIGMIPNSGLAPAEVVKNKAGDIVVNKNCETNVPGLYAAGDVTDVSFNQIVIAAGQGCIATLSAVQYLNKLK